MSAAAFLPTFFAVEKSWSQRSEKNNTQKLIRNCIVLFYQEYTLPDFTGDPL